jgi:hypothetical protein
VIVDATYEERYWYPPDGGIVWLAGYSLVDPRTGRFLANAAPELVRRGLRVASVAGVTHQPQALESDAAAPGRPLSLRRDKDNEHDPHAIAVDLADGEQLGWVPRDLAEELSPSIDAGEPWSALVLRERRSSPRDPRTGITMLLARGPQITLRTPETP